VIAIVLTLSLVYSVEHNTIPTYTRGLTDDFSRWLNDTGLYEPYGFNKTHIYGGSFGGREFTDQKLVKRPVVFVHGTSDCIIGDNRSNNGFRYTIEHFLT